MPIRTTGAGPVRPRVTAPLCLALLALLAACPEVHREPTLPEPPPGCEQGRTLCHEGAPWVCGPGGRWSVADRAGGVHRDLAGDGDLAVAVLPDELRELEAVVLADGALHVLDGDHGGLGARAASSRSCDVKNEGMTQDLQAKGAYQLRYNFDSSAQYEARLEQVRERQKAMMREGRAAVCDAAWVVDGNAKAGEKMVKDQIKLMLRAFNGECDAAVMRVRDNNVETLERRMRADFDAINKGLVLSPRGVPRSLYQTRRHAAPIRRSWVRSPHDPRSGPVAARALGAASGAFAAACPSRGGTAATRG